MKNKKIIILVIVALLILVLAILSIFRLVSYNRLVNQDILKINYSRCGGLLSYEQYLACPNVEITNDLKVTLKPGSGDAKDHEFYTYSISEDKYNNLVKVIKDSKFLLLPDKIEDRSCMDGGSSTIKVTFKDKVKETHIYCRNNKTYYRVEEAIIDSVISEDYSNYYDSILKGE